MKERMIGGGMMLLKTGRTENRFLKIIKNKESEEDDNQYSSSSPSSPSSSAAALPPPSSSSLTTLSVHVLLPSSSSSLSSQNVRKFPFLLPKITSALVRPISSSSSSSSASALSSSLMIIKAPKRPASVKNPMAKRLKTISGFLESNNETKEINDSKNTSRDNSPEMVIKTETNKVTNDDVAEDDVVLSKDVIKTEMCEYPENETKERKRNNSLAENSHKVLLLSRSTKVTTGDIYARRRQGRKTCKIENKRKQREQLISGKAESKTGSRELMLNLDETTSERLKIELHKVSRSIDRASSLMRLVGNKLKTLEERKRTLHDILIGRTEVTRARNHDKSSKMDTKWSQKRDILEEEMFDSSDTQIAATATPSPAHEHRYKMELFVSDLSMEVGDELPRAHEHKRDLSACTYLVCRR